MGFHVGLAGVFIALEARRLDDVLQHVAHVAVYIFYVEAPGLDGLDNIFHLCRIAGHQQVVAGGYLALRWQAVALAYPVGHDDAAETPVLTQHAGQQVFVALGKLTINKVVG